MSTEENVGRLEALVRASHYDPSAPGKQFLGAAIECSDGKVWVIHYSEQSPFHPFDGRRVVVFGEPYTPEGQHLIGWHTRRPMGHFRVSAMRLLQVTPDAELVEVGAGQELTGRFERGTSETGGATLSFLPERGDAFRVANDPAGMTCGPKVEVSAYPVQLSSSLSKPAGQYLWIICPCSAAAIWEWRGRRSC